MQKEEEELRMQREAEDAYAIIGDLDFALKAFQVRTHHKRKRECTAISVYQYQYISVSISVYLLCLSLFLGSPWIR